MPDKIIQGYKPLLQPKVEPRYNIPELTHPYEVSADKNYRPEMTSQVWNRADNQTWGTHLMNGLLSRTASIPLKLFGGVSNVLGLVTFGYGSGEFSQIWDNPINQAMDQTDEELKKMFPVYNSMAYDTAGGLFGKMATTSFWANDMFDGLAYLASAWVPSTGVSALVGAAGRSLSAANSTTKIIKGLKAIGMNTNRASMLGTTVYNTISESGAEAYQTQKEVEQALFDQGMEPAEAKRLAAEAAAGTFRWNAAALAIPNLVQASWFHGGWSDKIAKVRKAVAEGKGIASGEVISPLKQVLRDAGTGFASEGLWEENIQSAIQRYEKSWALGEDNRFAANAIADGMLTNLKGFAKSFIPDGKKLNDDEMEGAVAIALGGLIGMGAGAVAGLREAKQYNKLIETEQNRYTKLRAEYGDSAEKMFVANVGSIYESRGRKKVKTTNEKGEETEIEVSDFVTETDPDTGEVKLKKDFEQIAKGIFVQLRNKQLYDHSAAAALGADPLYDEFNKQMALASFAYTLAAKKPENYSDDEINTYLDELTEIGSEEAKQLGVQTYIKDNMGLVKEYVKTLREIELSAASPKDLGDNIDEINFNNFYIKTSMYVNAKKKALNNMLALAPNEKTKEGIQQVLDDLAVVEKDLKEDRAGIKQEYYDTTHALAKRLARAQELSKKKDRNEEESEELRRLNYEANEAVSINGVAQVFNATPRYSYNLDQTVLTLDKAASSAGLRYDHYYKLGRQKLIFKDVNEILSNPEAKEGDIIDAVEKFFNNIAILNDEAIEVRARLSERVDQILSENYAKRDEATDILETINELDPENPSPDNRLFVLSDEAMVSLRLMEPEENRAEKIQEIIDENGEDLMKLRSVVDDIEAEASDTVAKTTINIRKFDNLQKALNSTDYYKPEADFLTELDKADAEGQDKLFIKRHYDLYVGIKAENIIKEHDEKQEAVDKAHASGNTEAYNDYSNEETVLNTIERLKDAQAAFSKREGFDDIKKDIEDKLAALQGRVMSTILANKARRKQKQIAAGNNFVIPILDQLGVLSTSENKELKTKLISVLGEDQLDSVAKLLNDFREEFSTSSVSGIYSLLDQIREKATPDQLTELLDFFAARTNEINAEVIESYSKIVDPNKVNVVKYGHYIATPDTSLMQLLFSVFPKHRDNPTSTIFKYKVDGDLASLSDGYKIDPTLSDVEKEVLKTILNVHTKVVAINTIKKVFNSKAKYADINKAKKELTGNIKPTIEQDIVLTVALYELVRSGGVGNYFFNNWFLINGIAGSGKSFVVGKALTELIEKVSPGKKIVAFSAKDFTSSNINKAIFGEKGANTTFESFMSMPITDDMVIIIDEAFTFTNQQLKDINAKTSKSKAKVIALGDPSQVSAEPDGSMLTRGGGSVKDMKSSINLSASYRTNISSLSGVNMAYQMNINPVTTVVAQASHSLEDFSSLSSTETIFGVVSAGNNKDALRAALKKPTTRSRVLIVDSEATAKLYRNDFPGLNVLTYIDAQGYQWDEVFVSLTPELLGDNTLQQNQAVYTAVSRAKQFLFTEGLPISSTKNSDLETAIKQDEEEIAQNVTLFKASVDTAEQILGIFGATATKTPSPKRKEVVPGATPVDEEEQSLPPTIEEVSVNTEVKPGDIEVPNVNVAEFNTSEGSVILTHPTNFGIVSAFFDPETGKLRDDAVGQDIHIIKVRKRGYQPMLTLVTRIPDSENFVEVGVIGRDMINEDSSFGEFIRSVMNKSVKQLDDTKLTSSVSGNPIDNIDDYSIATVKFDTARKLSNIHDKNTTIEENVIEDTIIKFAESYFGLDARANRIYAEGEAIYNDEGVVIDTDPTKAWLIKDENGKTIGINWPVVSKNVRFVLPARSYNRTKTYEVENAVYNAYGVPTIVITRPNQSSKTKVKAARPIVIPLLNRRLNKDSIEFKTLSKFTNLMIRLEDLTGLMMGRDAELEELIRAYGKTNLVIAGINHLEIKDSPIKASEIATKYAAYTDPAIDEVLNELTPMMFATRVSQRWFNTEDEAKAFVDSQPEAAKKHLSVVERKGRGKNKSSLFQIMAKDSDDNVVAYEELVITSKGSVAQMAYNSITNANRVISVIDEDNSVIPYNTRLANRGTRAAQDSRRPFKSLLSTDRFIDYTAFYQDHKDFTHSDGRSLTLENVTNLAHLYNILALSQNGSLTQDEVNVLLDPYITTPVNTDMLDAIINEKYFSGDEHNSLLQPLHATGGEGLNAPGLDLGNPDNRAKINSLVRSNYMGTATTAISVTFPKPSTPEQKVEAPVDESFEDTTVEAVMAVRELTPQHQVIWNMLAATPEAQTRIRFGDRMPTDEPIAMYDFASGHIYANFNVARMSTTHLLHEMIHAVTMGSLMHALEHPELASPQQQEFLKRVTKLQELYDAYLKENNITDGYRRTLSPLNVHEFIANVSEPRFKEIATKIKVGKRSNLFKEIVNAILGLFNISKQTNVYDLTLKALEDLITKPTTPIIDTRGATTQEQQPPVSGRLNRNEEPETQYAFHDNDTPIRFTSTPGQITTNSTVFEAIKHKLDMHELSSVEENLLKAILSSDIFDIDMNLLNLLVGNSDIQTKISEMFYMFNTRDIDDMARSLRVNATRDTRALATKTALLKTPDNEYFKSIAKVIKIVKTNPYIRTAILDVENSSVTRYKILRDYVIEEVNKNKTTETTIRKTKLELLDGIRTSFVNKDNPELIDATNKYNALLAELKELGEQEINTPDSEVHSPKYKAIVARIKEIWDKEMMPARNRYVVFQSLAMNATNLLNRKSMFDTVISDIYPKNKISFDEDLSLFIDENDKPYRDREEREQQSSGGISEHIKKYNKSAELTLSESIKDLLNLVSITYKDKKTGNTIRKFLNPGFVYIKILQFIVDNDFTSIVNNTPESVIGKWEELITDALKQDGLNNTDRAILHALLDIVQRASSMETPSGTPITTNFAIHTNQDSDGKVYYRLVFDEDGWYKTESTATNMAEQKFYTSAAMIGELTNRGLNKDFFMLGNFRQDVPFITQFNDALDKAEALNLLRELANSMMSMKETDLMIGTRTNKKGLQVAYIKAKAAGINFGLRDQIRTSIASTYRSERGGTFEDRLNAYYPKAYSAYNSRKPKKPASVAAQVEAAKEFLSALGLGELANNLAFDSTGLEDFNNKALFFVKQTAAYIDLSKVKNVVMEEESDVDNTTVKGTLDHFFEHMNGAINNIATIAGKASVYHRNPSVKSSKGEKYYKIHESSWMYDVVNNHIKMLTRGGNKRANTFRDYPAYMLADPNTMTPEEKASSKVKFNDFFKNNIFLDGTSFIEAIAEHEALKQTDNDIITPYSRENRNYYFHREILQGFVDGIRQYGTKFNLFSPTPADKPKHPMYLVKLLSQQEVKDSVKKIIAHFEARKVITGYPNSKMSNSFKNDFYRDFPILASKEVEGLSGDALVNKVIELMENEAKLLVDDLVKVNLALDVNTLHHIHKQLGGKDSTVEQYFKDLPAPRFTEENYERGINNKVNDKYNEEELRPILNSIVDAYFKNHMVSSFFMNHIIGGDQMAYGDQWDMVKRMAGILAPGVRGLVDQVMHKGQNIGVGMRENYKVLVVNDKLIPKEYTSKRLKYVLYGADELTETQQAEFDEFMKLFGDQFERSDGQGFMTPTRFAELEKGFGRSWGLGNVMKPVHYEIQRRTLLTDAGLDQDGNPIYDSYTTAIPVYTKYSSIVLTDDLVRKFPVLSKIRTKLEQLGVDEMLFSSAVKLGGPEYRNAEGVKERLEFNDLIDDIDGKRADNPIDYNSMTITLSNRQYRLQHNPATDPNKQVSIFTQLMYFLSAYESTQGAADEAYEIVAELMANGRKEFEKKIQGKQQLRDYLASKFTGPGAERALQLVLNGISPSNPLLEKKSIISLVSGMEDATVKIKFNGGKLVLQTAEGITKYQDPDLFKGIQPRAGYDLRYRPEVIDLPGPDGRRQVRMMVAEVIVPESMLTKEQIQAVADKKPIYLLADGMGFRIPSTELHSAVPLRIVGTYSGDTNVIIAPQELVPIHGSDFDVDALFVIFPDKYEVKDGYDETRIKTVAMFEEYLKVITPLTDEIDNISQALPVEEYNIVKDIEDILDNITKLRAASAKQDAANELTTKVITLQAELDAIEKANPVLYEKGTRLRELHDKVKAKKEAFSKAKIHVTIDGANVVADQPVGYFKSKHHGGQYVFDRHKKQFYDELIADYEALIPKLKANPYTAKLANNVNQELKKVKAVRAKYFKNFILNTMLETIGNVQENGLRMLSPISFEVLEESAKEVDRLKGIEGRTRLDLSNPRSKFNSYLSLNNGQILTGAFANAVKVFAYTSRAGLDDDTLMELYDQYASTDAAIVKAKLAKISTVDLDKEKERIRKDIKERLKHLTSKPQDTLYKPRINSRYAFKLDIDGVVHDFNILREKDIRDQHGVTSIFDALLNAAIDNLKMQLLPRINVNALNGSAVVGMVSLGVPIDVVTKILSTEVLQDLVTGDVGRIRDWLTKAKEIVDQAQLSEDDILSDTMIDSLLRDEFIGKKSLVGDASGITHNDIMVLELFLKAHKIGEDMRNMASFLNIVREFDVFVEDLEEHENSLESKIGTVNKADEDLILSTKMDFSLIIPFIFKNNPHIKEAYRTKQSIMDIIEENFIQHSKEVRDMVEAAKITDLNTDGEVDSTVENKVLARRSLMRLVLNGLIWEDVVKTPTRKVSYDKKAERHITLSKARSYSENVIDEIKSLKEFYLSLDEDTRYENKLLELISIYIHPDTKRKTISITGGVNLNSIDIQDLYKGFKTLSMYRKDASGNWQVAAPTTMISDLQRSLLNYAVLNYGLEFSTANFASIIDNRLIKELDEYLEAAIKEYINPKSPEYNKRVEHFRFMYHVMNYDRLNYVPFSAVIEKHGSRKVEIDLPFATEEDNFIVYYDLLTDKTITDEYVTYYDKIYKRVFTLPEGHGAYQYIGKEKDIFYRPLLENEEFNLDERFDYRKPTVVYYNTEEKDGKLILYSSMPSEYKKDTVIDIVASHDLGRSDKMSVTLQEDVKKVDVDGYPAYKYVVAENAIEEFYFGFADEYEQQIKEVLAQKDQGCKS